MNVSERTKTLFKIVHTTVAVILLGICGIFIYEKNIITFDKYADIYAVVPGNIEFEGDEQITFFVFSETEKSVEVDITQKLMCDYGDGNGFAMISTRDSKLDIAPHAPEGASLARGIIDRKDATYTQTSTRLRTLVRKERVAEFVVYDGTIPRETSQCFVKFKFSKLTPRFNILKEHENVSYPFDYIWYFTTDFTSTLEEDD